jgi:hypothetical protein
MQKVLEYGEETFIITNAAKGWVEYSSKLYEKSFLREDIWGNFWLSFLPRLHETLIKGKVNIISARSTFEEKFPGNSKQWKVETFLSISEKMKKNVDFIF